MKLSASLFINRLLVVSFFLLAFSSVHANQLKGVRAWPSPDNTRVVLDLSTKPSYEIHYLKRPDRLVIDIASAQSVVNLKSIKHGGPLVKNIRESASNNKGTYRLVVDLKQPSKAKIFTLPPAKPYGHRLVIDLPHQAPKVNTAPSKPNNVVQKQPLGRDVIIAIDAGHGGDDPGALGKFSQEKKINLEIARRLQKRINRQPGMNAFLIRTGDYYINLNKRSELAVKGKADFLVSLHADGFTSSQPSGASVWILSDRRANSEMGRRMERHEVHSELLGGKGEASESASSVPFLNKVFFDMSKSNSMQVGADVGNLVVKELDQITKLHKKKPVGASLAVLKSPYIPSILVEAGFITNHREERLLNQAEHQNKIANAVFSGIYKHFNTSPPHDSLFAQKKREIQHTVRSGESLSSLGQRYSVASSELKSYNRLKSSSLRIGQVLKIPPNYELVVKTEPTPVRKLAVVQPSIHTVKSGESLSVIASRYGSSTSELKQYNNLRSTSLAVGQKLNIPSKNVVQVQPTVHTVRSGESLSVIASRYGKSTNELKSYNNLRSTSLAVGQKLKIPNAAIQVASTKAAVKQVSSKPVVHTVSRGESLSVIANRYGKSSNELKSYNNLRSTSLAIGQKLKIPNGATQTAMVKVPAKPIVHTVRSGESLSVIATRYGKSSNELKNHNNLRSTSLAIGQKLKIPNGAVQTVVVKAPVKPVVHTVRSGESLSVIAKRYGKTTNDLKNYNKLRSTSLSVGQKLKIPNGAVQVVKAPAKPVVHTVRSGDSLSVIAKRYSKSTNELKSYNNLRSTTLSIGQKIKIPDANYTVKAATSNKATVHTVRSGESLSVIAARYNTNSSVLKQYNGLRSTALSVGQKIKIPAGANRLTTHKVRSGESLSVIAQRYGTTASVIKSINKLRSNSLSIGQLLTIPTT
ncbi:hypothetical protein GCM10007916_36510 [Psychromonas marina]|uniref:LysM domain-containing protein n=1 Tax=Psychromonas marina TaxID=88364 RepID=A0ABQ6E587_9GAMM|nr:hypothetical protein GCM10007916_36510 [Psychromonas marina]